MEDAFDELFAMADSVSLFTTWSASAFEQAWFKRRVPEDGPGSDPPATLFGARRAIRAHHPIPWMDPVTTTQQLGVPGPWHERIPHFRMDYVASAGAELQSEYFVGREDAPAAIQAIAAIHERVTPLVQ